jgi:hypothetical protein
LAIIGLLREEWLLCASGYGVKERRSLWWYKRTRESAII